MMGCPLEGSDQVDVSRPFRRLLLFWYSKSRNRRHAQWSIYLWLAHALPYDFVFSWMVCFFVFFNISLIQNVLTIFFSFCRIDAILKFRYPPYTVTILSSFSFLFNLLIVFHGIHNKQKFKESSVFRLLGSLPARPTSPPVNATKQWWGKWFLLPLAFADAAFESDYNELFL